MRSSILRPARISPFSYLCSVGIVFKLCHALLKTRPLPGFDLRRRLDLVALGTVADIVPLEEENRILVNHGAREIARRQLLGMSELMEVAAVHPPIAAEDIGFHPGPRLNAAGRLTTAEKALRLLLTTDAAEAIALAGAWTNRIGIGRASSAKLSKPRKPESQKRICLNPRRLFLATATGIQACSVSSLRASPAGTIVQR